MLRYGYREHRPESVLSDCFESCTIITGVAPHSSNYGVDNHDVINFGVPKSFTRWLIAYFQISMTCTLELNAASCQCVEQDGGFCHITHPSSSTSGPDARTFVAASFNNGPFSSGGQK